jgi:opacity protein-like surface antigen
MIGQQRGSRFSIPAIRRHAPVWFALAALLAWTPAHAEGFLDLYFGVGFLEDSHIDTDADDIFVKDDLAFTYRGDTEWEDSPSLGLRGGYWFGQYGPSFIGVGLDLSYYQAVQDRGFAKFEAAVTPMTPLLMLRIPLGYDEDFPGGRVQPYVAVGPSFTLAYAHVETDEIFPSNSADFAYDDFDEAGFGVGFDGHAGLAVQLAPSFALFGEYRYTYVEPHFEEDLEVASTPFFFETEVEFEPELETHHIVFGASFRF